MYKKSQKRRAAYSAAMDKAALTDKELAGALAEKEAKDEEKAKGDLDLGGGFAHEGGSIESISSTGSLSDSETDEDDNDFYGLWSEDE